MVARLVNDIIDGREVPPTVINTDSIISGVHQGTVIVESGCLTLNGVIQGTLSISPGASADIFGSQQGTVLVSTNSRVTIHGAIQGSCTIEPNGIVVVESSGKLAGTLHNNGTVINRGVFGGATSGSGKFMSEASGYVKQQTIKDGIHYYEW